SRAAVEQAEQYADGQASKKGLTPVRVEARKAALRKNIPYWRQRAFHACLKVVADRPASEVAEGTAIHTSGAVVCKPSNRRGESLTALAAQAVLPHGLWGTPFRPVTVSPGWLAWNDGTVPRIAQAIYEERAFDRLPVLADALEEAGCDNADILAHCR